MPPKKMTANPLKPARHRTGKPTLDEAPSASSEEEEEEEEEEPEPPKLASKPPLPKATSFPKASLTARQKLTSETPAEALARQKLEAEFETESESGSGSEESGSESGSGSEEEESEEEESSSEDEAPKLLRPVFMKKNQRSQAPTQTKSQDEVYAEEERRKQEAATALVQEQLERAAAAKRAGKKNWDDEDNVEETDGIDDTDNVDREAEYAAWKLRELMRIKRARAAIEAAEEERAEVERRRNLTQAERDAEDREYLEKQKEERGEGRGQMQFMQKYFHKGAFFQDDLKDAGVDRRSLMGARFEDSTNREILPEYMQIRDMTKLGKKGRTKYKDMKSEDTGRWGDLGDRRGGGKGAFGVDERFRPDDRFKGDERGRDGGTGANAKPLGERKRGGEDDWRDGKRPRIDDRH